MLKSLPNTNIRNLKKQYGWLRRLPFTEEETRGNSMPVHIILGAADYQQIRTTKPLTLGAKPRQGPRCRVHNAQTRTIWKIVLSWCSRDCWHRSKTGWLSTQRISTATNEDAWWILWDQIAMEERSCPAPYQHESGSSLAPWHCKEAWENGKIGRIPPNNETRSRTASLNQYPRFQQGRSCTTYLIKLSFERMQKQQKWGSLAFSENQCSKPILEWLLGDRTTAATLTVWYSPT